MPVVGIMEFAGRRINLFRFSIVCSTYVFFVKFEALRIFAIFRDKRLPRVGFDAEFAFCGTRFSCAACM